MFKTLRSAFLAGVCISLGGTAFLKVGGIIGAVLFTFGLLTVVSYQFKLYTGTAGFAIGKKDYLNLIIILSGNVLGCIFIGKLIGLSDPSVIAAADKIVAKRESLDLLSVLFLGGCCGFIMTTAVKFGRKKLWLPLLFGVPLFIMCGFLHSIADAFYYSASSMEIAGMIPVWITTVIGNFLGCNITRFIMFDKNL